MCRHCNRKYALPLVAACFAFAAYALVWRVARLPTPQPQRQDWRPTEPAATGGGGGGASNSSADGRERRTGGVLEAAPAAAGRRGSSTADAAAAQHDSTLRGKATDSDTASATGLWLRGGGAVDGGGGADLFLHNREYRVLIECGNICQTDRLFLIVLVCSRPENGARRATLRRTWASVLDHRGQTVRTAFVLGRTAAASVQADVSAESAAWGDVLQVDVDESYRNLTLKTMLGLRFALAACRDALFVMKTDDDVVANYRTVVDYLLGLSVAAARHLYAGSVHRDTRPVRDPADKWHVSVAEYGRPLYPPYAGGSGYVLSMAAAALVDRASAAVRYLSMEDAFVGVCAERAGVAARHDDAFQGYWFRATACRLRALFTSHGWEPDEMEDAWRLALPLELDADGGGRPGASSSAAPSPGNDRTCPPLEWLLYYYEDSDDEVDRKYLAEVADERAKAADDAGAADGDFDDGS